MTDETTNLPSAQTHDPKELLGKPVPNWKTGSTKLISVLEMIAGGVSTVIGAAGLIRGRKVQASEFPSALNGVLVANGIATATIGKLGFDSADSAAKTRNYLEVSAALNEQSASKSQTRG
jgi:hypothetical protein